MRKLRQFLPNTPTLSGLPKAVSLFSLSLSSHKHTDNIYTTLTAHNIIIKGFWIASLPPKTTSFFGFTSFSLYFCLDMICLVAQLACTIQRGIGVQNPETTSTAELQCQKKKRKKKRPLSVEVQVIILPLLIRQ